MKYKAIFFDRDGTITFNDPEWEQIRIKSFEEWSGKPFDKSYVFFMKVFNKVLTGGFSFAPYKTVEQELEFFRQWFLFAFEEVGISEKIYERADYLTQHLWYLKKQLYPETIEVLEYFKNNNYKMGVISDSPPSLELTLELCGIHKYFSSFTASSLVGEGKPSPKIFNSALKLQNVTPEESIYVDDCKIEADGARNLGFTSFLINRSNELRDKWTIRNLSQIVNFVMELENN